MIRTSLNFRLWLTIAIAVLPVLLFVFFDFHERREQAVAETRAEIALRLADANREAQAAHRAVALVLRIMARSNDLQRWIPRNARASPGACSSRWTVSQTSAPRCPTGRSSAAGGR
jgi:hypothetical protein